MVNKETFYEKVCRYTKLFKQKNVKFLNYLFKNFDLYKKEVGARDDEVRVDKLIVFTAVKDYENKFDFCEV